MTAWLWLFGCFIAWGVVFTAAEAVNARREGGDPATCLTCDRPPRTIPTPIPDGAIVSFIESVTGRAHYCQACFDALDGPEETDADT